MAAALPSATSKPKAYSGRMASDSSPGPAGGRSDVVLYKHPGTKLILKKVFGELCPACQKYLSQVEREVTRLDRTNPDLARIVRKLSYHLVEIIRQTEQISFNLDSFVEQRWELHAGNIYMEFSKVALETFKEKPNWGRVITFLGFAVSFVEHLEEGIVVGAAESILEWTAQVIEEDLGQFFSLNNGWVSYATLQLFRGLSNDGV